MPDILETLDRIFVHPGAVVSAALFAGGLIYWHGLADTHIGMARADDVARIEAKVDRARLQMVNKSEFERNNASHTRTLIRIECRIIKLQLKELRDEAAALELNLERSRFESEQLMKAKNEIRDIERTYDREC